MYGHTGGDVVTCEACGHGSLLHVPAADALGHAYDAAVDDVSARETTGRSVTAARDLAWIAAFTGPSVRLCDIGCWTGALVAAAGARGWSAVGLEPSEWAVAQAACSGLDVRRGSTDAHDLEFESFDVVTMCDVVEHLADPRAGLDAVRSLLRPGGTLFLTVPDAGSVVARVLGRRWWSVLPMHLQYFTLPSLARLLEDGGFDVIATRRHAKAFTVRYYTERFAGYHPSLAARVTRLAELARVADRMIAPNFRDRLAVVARRRQSSDSSTATSRSNTAGTPAASQAVGTSRVTTEFAPITARSPISVPLAIVALAATQTLRPIRTGAVLI